MPITLTGSLIEPAVVLDKVHITKVRMELTPPATDAALGEPSWVVDFMLYGTDGAGNRTYGNKTFSEKFTGGSNVVDRIETALAARLEQNSGIDTAVVS